MRTLVLFFALCSAASADIIADHFERAALRHQLIIDPVTSRQFGGLIETKADSTAGTATLVGSRITYDGIALTFPADSWTYTRQYPYGAGLANWTITASIEPYSIAVASPVTADVTFRLDNAESGGVPREQLATSEFITIEVTIQGPETTHTDGLSYPMWYQPRNWLDDMVLYRGTDGFTENFEVRDQFWIQSIVNDRIIDTVVDGQPFQVNFGPSEVHVRLSSVPAVTAIPEANGFACIGTCLAVFGVCRWRHVI